MDNDWMLNAKLVEEQFNDNRLTKDRLDKDGQMMNSITMDRWSRKIT